MRRTFALIVGYRRLQDDRVEPICDPPVNQILLILWKEVGLVRLKTDRFLVTAAEDTLTFEGHMRPNELIIHLSQLAQFGRRLLKQLANTLCNRYPFESVAQDIVTRARPQLLTQLDQPFVVTEAPAFTEGDSIFVERPRVEFEGGRLRVIVTGVGEDHPLRVWADTIIREGVRDAVLERILRGGGTIDA